MALILCIQFTFANYKTSKKFSKNLDVAKPIFIVEGTETSKISAINNVGYYNFTVKNCNETEVSETAFTYSIEVVADTDESIKFELYEGEKQIPLENLKTGKLTIEANKEMKKEYQLKIIYDKTLGTKGKDILQEVQIKVHSEQAQKG